MATSIWGLLKESLTSSKLIREAIADMIADHDNDPTSHLGETGSLQSHKASEIIDHEALSIISDKIASGQIYGGHMDTTKMLIKPAFESVDAYFVSKTGVNSLVTPQGAGCVDLIPGETNGNRVALSCDMFDSIEITQKNPCLDFYVGDGEGNSNLWLGFGSTNFDNTTQAGIFFRWNRSDGKLYASVRYKDETSPYATYLYEQLIFTISQLSYNHLRIEVDDVNNCVRFYLDNVLKWTHSFVVGKKLNLVTYFGFVSIHNSGGETGNCQILNLQYYQDV